MPVIRFGVSLEKELLDALDSLVEENLFVNRSQAIRHLISNGLAESKWHCNNEVVGSLTMLYDHHRRGLLAQLTRLQHERNDMIISSLHLHLGHGHCMELLAVRGRAADLTALADQLRSIKGVSYARLTLTRLTGGEHHEEK
jgi:CopG family transcriptional regulator, nickel-responsive regulator